MSKTNAERMESQIQFDAISDILKKMRFSDFQRGRVLKLIQVTYQKNEKDELAYHGE